jgi:hypothetical protein
VIGNVGKANAVVAAPIRALEHDHHREMRNAESDVNNSPKAVPIKATLDAALDPLPEPTLDALPT